MGRDLNQLMIVGNVGQDVEVKTFDNGGSLANFSVATTESWKDKQTGEWKDDTVWHRVVVKNQFMIEKAERVVRKGERVLVQGQSKTRKYTDSNGDDKFVTELVIPPFGMGMLEIQPSNKSNGAADSNSLSSQDSSNNKADGAFDEDDLIPFD
tara:strand:+ start:68 stop:526 length:459 start_codon:yes stop_codon:yes gene_type:complete